MMSTTKPELIPFDHTYILYDPSNPLSLAISILSLTPILVLVFLFSWFLITREVEPCILAAGHVSNDIISTVIKKLVKFERPLSGQIFKKDGSLVYGMPSSHSQFVAFLTGYMILKLLLQWPSKLDKLTKSACISGFGLMEVSVMFSRLYFSYHNLNQVLVGTLLGFALSSMYFLFVSILRDYSVLDLLLSYRICEWLQMKDSFAFGAKVTTLKEERDIWESTQVEIA